MIRNIKFYTSERAVYGSGKEEKKREKREEKRLGRMLETKMRGIASFYRERDRALLLLKKYLLTSANKIAARDIILLHHERELGAFKIRGAKDSSSRKQELKILERALSRNQPGSIKGKRSPGTKVDRQYYGSGRR